MEDSRKQYESDAQRYKVQYEQAEKKSDTLRMKLGDIEQNFVDMQQATEDSRRAGDEMNGDTPHFGLTEPDGEPDDLQEIVGIGKVFEEMLPRSHRTRRLDRPGERVTFQKARLTPFPQNLYPNPNEIISGSKSPSNAPSSVVPFMFV